MTYFAGVLIKKDNHYLLVQEKKSEAHGQWNLPAGRVEEGETLQEAAKREAKEETGLDVEVGTELLKFIGTSADREIHIFSSSIIAGDITWNRNELLDIKWFTKEEIQTLNLRSENYRSLFE